MDVAKKVGLIPVRLESSRLPKKAILDIAGRPMIVHVAKRAAMARLLDEVIVCTDSEEIANICLDNSIKIILTKSSHINGTERIAEASDGLNLNEKDIIIDIQGDEPLLMPQMIDNVIKFMENNPVNDIVVPYITISDGLSPNRVKIVESNGRIYYMSRASVPYSFLESTHIKKHLSIIGFKRQALSKFYECKQSPLERVEGIELLRALENGLIVGTYEEHGESLAVDTRDDYDQVNRLMLRDSLFGKY
ncbi:3-deoxy-manno-octulosonate cytidylyltransferase [Polynucleobacter antarcticus]|uniref:3-deoxy-manno-octulosonate cytidylyltransferase n=1 Tax=Polynucleobacter antarcticus TaxID=1743162 RepID=A0A6M9PGG8_9BURK|nr:3-deoxy-manno-octulosonate cytidylyltransferase [Polynucleobacter antarcticus]QKM61900.1 3-deoxy-manno-octulosonate cytidylyltransferase [Polynucleobacter antarcticus]